MAKNHHLPFLLFVENKKTTRSLIAQHVSYILLFIFLQLLEPVRKKFKSPELQRLCKLAYPEPKKASKYSCISSYELNKEENQTKSQLSHDIRPSRTG